MQTDTPTPIMEATEHRDWLAREIERGVQSAYEGRLVPDSTIVAWIETLER